MARQVVVQIIGDAKSFTKSLDEAAGRADGFGSKFSNVAKVVAAGGAIIGGVAVGVGLKVLDMGSNFEAMDAKASTVFGNQIGLVKDWAAENAAAMGLTSRQATGLAANFADLLIPMGFTRDQAADMSTKVVGLSGALSEWSGGTKSAAEVADILSKAMLGERDGLKALGISISEADVQARLAANGQAQLTGAALEQAKALATQQLIFEKSTDAQAAYAEGTAKGLRVQAEFNAMMGEVVEQLVTALYPAVLTIATFLKENLPPAIETAKQVFETIRPTLEDIAAVFAAVFAQVAQLVGDFVELVSAIWTEWGDEILAVAQVVFGFIADTIKNAMTVIRGIIDTVTALIKGDWSGVWNGIKTIVSGVWDQIGNIVRTALNNLVPFIVGAISKLPGLIWDAISSIPGMFAEMWSLVVNDPYVRKGLFDFLTAPFRMILDFLAGLPPKIANVARGMWDGISQAFKDAINTIIRGWNSLKFTVPSIDLGPLGKIGGFTVGTPNIPLLHTGGVVPGIPGTDVLAMLQAGERVLPSGSDGGTRTVNINLNVTVTSPDGTVSELDAAQVAEMLNASDLVRALEHMAAAA